VVIIAYSDRNELDKLVMVDRINSVGVWVRSPQLPKVSRGFGGGTPNAEAIFFQKKNAFLSIL